MSCITADHGSPRRMAHSDSKLHSSEEGDLPGKGGIPGLLWGHLHNHRVSGTTLGQTPFTHDPCSMLRPNHAGFLCLSESRAWILILDPGPLLQRLFRLSHSSMTKVSGHSNLSLMSSLPYHGSFAYMFKSDISSALESCEHVEGGRELRTVDRSRSGQCFTFLPTSTHIPSFLHPSPPQLLPSPSSPPPLPLKKLFKYQFTYFLIMCGYVHVL